MNKIEGSTRYINLHVSYTVDTREDGNDYPGFFVVISENNNQNDFHYWMDKKAAIIKAIYDVNTHNNGYSVDDKTIFDTTLRLIREYFLSDSEIREIYRTFDFNEMFSLQNYSIAYIALLMWINNSEFFNNQAKRLLELESNEFLDEIYINEWIKRTLNDNHCYCSINLYHTFHGEPSINDIESENERKIVNDILDSFISAINDMIFVSDEEMEEIGELSELLDDISEGMEEGDSIIIKGKVKSDDETPIN